ncbi:hypothetical protein V5799_023012 [Amblyomma americanum]|uniref:Uncharacterized protein n=1 Tax=Amblyomma americanum TaxID=6943 RepID=A0AAQ4FJH5_AMBAM
MPPLPKNDIKIIVRIRGGLNIARSGAAAVAAAITAAACKNEVKREADTTCPNYQQKIVVVSTPEEENATKYVRIKELCIAGDAHAAAAYRAAPHEACKGIIRNVPLSEGPEAPSRKIVNPRNPLALAGKRIKESGTVIVAFDGYKVPNYVRNMHPERNVGRRKALWACLLRLIRDENQKVGFVDASFNEERKVFTVVVVDN